MGLVSARCRHARNCWYLYWRETKPLPVSYRIPYNTVYRQCAILHRFCPVYAAVLPSKRHQTVGKKTGKTSYIERFNNTTLRQSVSRLVRITLSNSYVIRESHWCHLVFHSLLQYIITCLVLLQSKS